MVRRFDRGYYCRGIHSINPAPGNPLDSLHSLNRLHRRSIRYQVIKIINLRSRLVALANR